MGDGSYWARQSAKEERQRKERELTAHHEAGHTVAAWYLGARLQELSMDVNRGLCLYQHRGLNFLLDDEPSLEVVRDAIAISLSGIAAETRHGLEVGEMSSVRNLADGRQDLADCMARLFLTDPEALQGLEDPDGFFRAHRGRATSLVYSDPVWSVIAALATTLLERRKMSGQEAVKVILDHWQGPLPPKARPIEEHKKSTEQEQGGTNQ